MNRDETESPAGRPVRTGGLIWRDELTGAAVLVNGAWVEIVHGAVVPYSLTPDEAETFADELTDAIVRACAWATRWNPASRGYDGISG